ncbi:MAG: ribonuclease H-like domain-containing protein [Eubacteriales bacterium]|nr:ribonuclease H-like domain-containing protein [Eubacteriales bacterium]
MRIISKPVDPDLTFSLPDVPAEAKDVLFLDIETTGISREKSAVYLIGCVCMQPEGWQLTQWFDDTGMDEKMLLSSFLVFCGKFRYVINYNGNRFDLPFLRARMEAHGLLREGSAAAFLSMESVDLYGYIAPFRHLLGLPDYKQQTVEAYLQTGRTEEEDAKALIDTYKKYLYLPSLGLLDRLTAHNAANVEGILKLLPLSAFARLEKMQVTVTRAQANYYTDHEGKPAEELLVRFKMDFSLPARVYAGADHCYLKIDGDSGVLKIPLYSEEMKYFYANYKDYYYLPAEDMAIHKYIASFVDPGRRIQARPETCYTRKTASYLPQWDLYRTPFFKRGFEDREFFFEFSEDIKKDRAALSDYAAYVLRHIIFRKP